MGSARLKERDPEMLKIEQKHSRRNDRKNDCENDPRKTKGEDVASLAPSLLLCVATLFIATYPAVPLKLLEELLY